MKTSDVINLLESDVILIPCTALIQPGTGYVVMLEDGDSVLVNLWCLDVSIPYADAVAPRQVLSMVPTQVRYRPPATGMSPESGWYEIKLSTMDQFGTGITSGHRYVMTILPPTNSWHPVTIGPFGVDDGRMEATLRWRSWTTPTGNLGEDGLNTYFRIWTDNNQLLAREMLYNGRWAGPVRFCDEDCVPIDYVDAMTPFYPDPSTIQFMKSYAGVDWWQFLVWTGNATASDTGALLDELCLDPAHYRLKGWLLTYNHEGQIQIDKTSAITHRTFIKSELVNFGTTPMGWCGLGINASAAGDPALAVHADGVKMTATAQVYKRISQFGGAYKPGIFDLDSMVTTVGADRIMALCPYRILSRSGKTIIEYYKFDCSRFVYDGTYDPDHASVLEARIGYREVWDPSDTIPVTYQFNVFNPTGVCLHAFVPIVAEV